ncbi:MAG: hypothetical protein U9Q63_00535 [Patescibacteria group bacterium]|nr:hypothetical protein [Patescibacteria group bacterium]
MSGVNKKEVNPRIEKTVNYLEEISDVKAPLLTTSLKLMARLSKEKWFDVALFSEELKGMGGVLAVFGFNLKLSFKEKKDKNQYMGQVVFNVIDHILEQEKLRQAEIKGGEFKDIKEISKKNSIVRLVGFDCENEKMVYRDYKISDILDFPNKVDLQNRILNGDLDIEKNPKAKPIDRWMDDDNEEAPLLVISVGSEINVRDPRVLLHINFDPKIDEINYQFGHTPIDGVRAQEQIDSSLNLVESKPSDASENYNEDIPSLKVSEKFLGLGVIGYKKSQEESKSVGGEDIVLDSLGIKENEEMKKLIAEIGLSEIVTKMEIPKQIMKFLLKNKNAFGGMINIWTLAGLLTSGQAPFFPVDAVDTKEVDFSIGLAMGGGVFTEELRETVRSFREFFNKEENIETLNYLKIFDEKTKDLPEKTKKQLKGFWTMYRDKKVKEKMEDEIGRAKKGYGVVSLLAEVVGANKRRFIQSLSESIWPRVSVFLRSKLQVSSLGKELEGIAKKGSLSFNTALSETVSIAMGIIGNKITGRFNMADSLIWMEALERALEDCRVVFDFNKAIKNLNKKEKIKLEKLGIIDWVHSMKVDNINVKEVIFGGEKNIKTFWRTIGKDSNQQKKVIKAAKGIILLISKLPETEKKQIIKMVKHIPQEKLKWFLIHAVELGILASIKEGKVDGETAKIILWAEEERNSLSSQRLKLSTNLPTN